MMRVARYILLRLFIASIILFFFPAPSFAATNIQLFQLYQAQPYVDTGMDIRIGDNLLIRQIGSSPIYPVGRTVPWVVAAGDPGCTAGVDFTLPGVNCWSLVARIGTASPFYNGYNNQFIAVQSGRLYLGINHAIPLVAAGGWTIQVIHNFGPPPPLATPFLELPWDYAGAGLSFDESALNINSYFDHEYPLLSVSFAIQEPQQFSDSIVNLYGPPRVNRPYSSHDGYDWGRGAGRYYNYCSDLHTRSI